METAFAQTTAQKDAVTNVLSGPFDFASRLFIVIVILVISLFIGWFVAHKVVEAIRKNQKEKEQEHQEMIVLASRLIYIFSAILGVAIGLGITDLFGELGWLLGAIGLGIGFALQTIIGNYVAGLTLLMQGKLHIGDLVEIDDFRGIITYVGARAVTVHDILDGTDILIPNLDFFNKFVRVFTANPYRRVWVDIGVGYDTNFPVAYDKIFDILKRYPDEIQQEPPPDILCTEIKDSAVNLRIRWWIKSNMRWWTIRSNVLRDVFVELQEIGVDISFPIRTLRIDSHESDEMYNYVKKDTIGMYEGSGIRPRPKVYKK